MSSMDGDRERGKDVVEGRYDRRGDTGLVVLVGKLGFLTVTRTVGRCLGESFFLLTWAIEDHCAGEELLSS